MSSGSSRSVACYRARLPDRPGTYHAAAKRPPCARVVRDEELVVEIRRVHGENYGVCAAPKMWKQLHREGTRSPGARWNV